MGATREPETTGSELAERRRADAVYRKIMWRIMPILVVCYLVSLIDRANIGVAKLQFTGDLGFSNAVYGFGAGIFFVGYVLLEIPSNLYLAKVGARKTLLRILLIWGPCCAAMGFMDSAHHFYILRFLLGAAEAGFFPGMLLYITFWIPAARRARFNTIFLIGIPLSGLIGGPLGGWIMHAFDGQAGLRGWQWLFLLEGAPAVVLAGVVFLFLSDRPEQSRWLSADEKALVRGELEADADRKRGHAHAGFRQALRDPRLYALSPLALGLMVSTGGVFYWLPTIIRDSGVSDILEIGLLSALPFLIAVVVQYLVARRSDLRQERRWHAVIPTVVAAIGWAVLPLVGANPWMALVALTLACAGTFAALGPFWSMPSQLLSEAAAPGGIALITSIGGLGSFISPMIVGWLVDVTGSLVSGQIYFAMLLVIGALAGAALKSRAAPPPHRI